MLQNKKLLIIEDDINLRQSLKIEFTRAGATIYTANDGEAGLRLFNRHQPDLVLLDIQMPVMDGWETCAQIRSLSNAPIIILTTMNQDFDMVRGLRSGADDFVTKPFSRDVLLARIDAVLRRVQTTPEPECPQTYSDGYLQVDFAKRQVLVRSQAVKISTTEFKLLSYLLKNAGQTLSYQAILTNVWGWEHQDRIEYVHVYISRLRRLLEENPQNPHYLFGEHGVGYGFTKQTERVLN